MNRRSPDQSQSDIGGASDATDSPASSTNTTSPQHDETVLAPFRDEAGDPEGYG